VSGDAGFYCETWGGGWNMTDATYLRSYNNKQVYASNYFYSDSGYKVGGTVIVDSSRNLTSIGTITASGTVKTTGSFVLGGSGSYEAGCIYTDFNWGMLFRAKQANPEMGEHMWARSDGTEIMRLLSDRITLNGYTQPTVISSANFSGQTGFYTNNWDLNNYANTAFRSVEVRLIIDRVGTNGGVVTFAFGDNGGNYCAPQEATTFNQGKNNSSSSTATFIPNAEVNANGYGIVLRMYRPYANSGRFHYEFTSVGCYAGAGATTSRGSGFATPFNAYISRLYVTTSTGTMNGSYSITQYI
jgi:hypothetical protein